MREASCTQGPNLSGQAKPELELMHVLNLAVEGSTLLPTSHDLRVQAVGGGTIVVSGYIDVGADNCLGYDLCVGEPE
jgi:hypothetical protein